MQRVCNKFINSFSVMYNMDKKEKKVWIKENIWNKHAIMIFIKMTIGAIALIFGNYFFKVPNNFAFGGVAGIAILLAPITTWSVGTINMVVSIALLMVGFVALGKSFGLKTAYVSMLLSVGLSAMEALYPMSRPLTDQPFLEFMFAILLTAVGSGVLFQCEASSGGTDIIAMIFKKITGGNIGIMLIISDVIVAIGAFFVFDITAALFSMLGLITKSLIIDNTIDSINRRKYVHIICDNSEEVCDFIINNLGRSATIVEGTGAFTHQDKYIIMSVMSGRQVIQLRRYLKEKVPTAFLLVSKTSEIFGNGFMSI